MNSLNKDSNLGFSLSTRAVKTSILALLVIYMVVG